MAEFTSLSDVIRCICRRDGAAAFPNAFAEIGGGFDPESHSLEAIGAAVRSLWLALVGRIIGCNATCLHVSGTDASEVAISVDVYPDETYKMDGGVFGHHLIWRAAGSAYAYLQYDEECTPARWRFSQGGFVAYSQTNSMLGTYVPDEGGGSVVVSEVPESVDLIDSPNENAIAAIQAKLDALLESVGGNQRFKRDALKQTPGHMIRPTP